MRMARLDCGEVRELLTADADDELTAAEREAVRKHVDQCADCRKAFDDLKALTSRLRAAGTFAMPPDLRARVEASIDTTAHGRAPAVAWRRIGVLAASHAAVAVLCAALTMWLVGRQDLQATMTRDLVAAHVRSMLAGPLVHVASSDTHTLKPWLVTKLPFAAHVTDLTGQGFPLQGARVEYVLGQPAAALVYERRHHRINVLVLRAADVPMSSAMFPTAALGGSQQAMNGFNVLGWQANDLVYIAISDLNVGELRELALALIEQGAAR